MQKDKRIQGNDQAKESRRNNRKKQEKIFFEYFDTVMRITLSDATKKFPSYVSLNEMKQCAMIGLWDAAARVDLNTTRPEIFLIQRAKFSIVDGLRVNDRCSRTMRKCFREKGYYTPLVTSIVSLEEIADEEEAEKGRSRIERIGKMRLDKCSPIISDFYEQSVKNNPMQKEEEKEFAHALLNILKGREKKIFHDIFFTEKTNMDIGNELGITESRITQIKTKCIAKIKERVNSNLRRTI